MLISYIIQALSFVTHQLTLFYFIYYFSSTKIIIIIL